MNMNSMNSSRKIEDIKNPIKLSKSGHTQEKEVNFFLLQMLFVELPFMQQHY